MTDTTIKERDILCDENERLKAALQALLDCPDIADNDCLDKETIIAERAARAVLKQEQEWTTSEVNRVNRMMKRNNDHWIKAAEAALSGNSQLLRNRVEMFKLEPAVIKQSTEVAR